MDIILIIFCILLLIISLIGLSGNLRFFIITYKETHIHKKLLLLLTILHIPYCIIIILDSIRVFVGISLTRYSCLRFIGAISAVLSLSQSLLHSFIGIELIVMIATPLWFYHLKAWWFYVPVFISLLFSSFLIYNSWIATEDYAIILCSPQTALSEEYLFIGNTFIFVNNIIVTILYFSLLVILFIKKGSLRDNLLRRLTISSGIIALVFVFSWFSNIALIRFAVPLGELFDVLPSTIYTFAVLPAVLTFSQTHYVYFFVSSNNRKAFRERGPIALFSGNSGEGEKT